MLLFGTLLAATIACIVIACAIERRAGDSLWPVLFGILAMGFGAATIIAPLANSDYRVTELGPVISYSAVDGKDSVFITTPKGNYIVKEAEFGVCPESNAKSYEASIGLWTWGTNPDYVSACIEGKP